MKMEDRGWEYLVLVLVAIGLVGILEALDVERCATARSESFLSTAVGSVVAFCGGQKWSPSNSITKVVCFLPLLVPGVVLRIHLSKVQVGALLRLPHLEFLFVCLFLLAGICGSGIRSIWVLVFFIGSP